MNQSPSLSPASPVADKPALVVERVPYANIAVTRGIVDGGLTWQPASREVARG